MVLQLFLIIEINRRGACNLRAGAGRGVCRECSHARKKSAGRAKGGFLRYLISFLRNDHGGFVRINWLKYSTFSNNESDRRGLIFDLDMREGSYNQRNLRDGVPHLDNGF